MRTLAGESTVWGMQRFFFDIIDNGQTSRDDDGMEWSDLEAAQRDVLSTLAEIARDELCTGHHRELAIAIRDEDGRRRLTARLSLSVERGQ